MPLNQDPETAPSPAKSPPARVWILLGNKAGDNAQLRALARLLEQELEQEEKELRYNFLHCLPNWMLGASFVSLANLSDLKNQPWPDLVFAVGSRSAPIARAIKKASSGETKLIHLGRPRADLDHFDLVITTPQYGLPVGENVLQRSLPLVAGRPSEEADWDERLKIKDQSSIALLIGGNAAPYRFTPKAVQDLTDQSSELCRALKADLWVTAGRRLPDWALPVLQAGLATVTTYFHSPKDGSADNPYGAYLTKAEGFIVTSDSVSMMAEAAATGRPLWIFPVPSDPWWWRLLDGLSSLTFSLLPQSQRDCWMRKGWLVPRRRTHKIAESLVASGRAQWLDHLNPQWPEQIDRSRPYETEAPLRDRILALIAS